MTAGYHFSRASLDRLETIHPDLRILFKAVLLRRDCKIMCGVRTKPEQDRLYNLGHSKLAWPNSKHNVQDTDDLAMAVDVAPYFGSQDPPIIWPDASLRRTVYAKQLGLFYDFHGYVAAQADMLGIAIRWGGDWDGDGIYTDQTFDDLCHFELVDGGNQNSAWII